MTKNIAIEAAYEALDGRLGLDGSDGGMAVRVLEACQEYVLTEDALPGDEFDGEDYQLSKAVAALVKQRDDARRERDEARGAVLSAPSRLNAAYNSWLHEVEETRRKEGW